MTKLVLINVADLQNENSAVATMAANNTSITTAFENTLSRDGTIPNQMGAQIDMNSYKIINLPPGASNGEAVNFQQLNALAIGAYTGALIINTVPLIGGTSGGILFNNGGVLSCTDNVSAANLRTSGTFTIIPPTNTLTRGLDIEQVGTDGGTTAGSVLFNSISSFFRSTVTGNAIGFQVAVGVGHNANAVEIFGGSFSVTVTESASVGEPVGVSSGVEILAGVSTNSNAYGGSSATVIRAGAYTPQAVGWETDNFNFSALLPYRFGYTSGSFGDHNALTLDAAYSVFTAGGSTNPWKNVICLVSGVAVGSALPAAVSTDSNFFTSESAVTMSRILDLRNITVGNYIVDASKVKLSDGGLTLGSNATSGSMAMNGPNGGAVFGSFQSSSVPRWTYGITTVNDFAINDPENARISLFLSKTTGAASVRGTNTNDNASASYVGEIIESTVLVGSAVSLTTATAANVTSISLTAGDWDIWGNTAYTAGGSTVISITDAWISPTSATLPTAPNAGALTGWVGSITGFAKPLSAGMRRISINATTTVYLSTQASFTTSTLAGYGYIGARRVR